MTTVEGGAAPAAPPAPAGPGRARHVAGTDPYPWPHDGILDGDRVALVIAGGQRWWARQTTGVPDALDAIERLRSAAHVAGAMVVHIVHTGLIHTGLIHTGPARHARTPYLPAPGSADALAVVEPVAGDVVVAAAGLSGAFGGPLEATLRGAGRDHLILAGLGLEGPVHSTLRDLNDQGYECLLVADACSFDTPTTRDAAVSSVTMSGGIFGATGTTDAIVAALTTATLTAATLTTIEALTMEARP